MKLRGKQVKKSIINLLICGLLISMYPITAITTYAEEQINISRVYGETRIDTAIKIAEKGWSDQVKTVLISRKDEFADALVSTPYAYKLNAPILLTGKSSLDSETKKKLKEWMPEKVIILGGKTAVSQIVEDEIKDLGLLIERIGGENRYDTAALIASKIGESDTGILAYGQNFPDALSIAPYAARNGIPILLTEKDEIPQISAKSLKNKKKTIIVGGPEVISTRIEGNVYNPTRIGGIDRFETSALIHAKLGESSQSAYIASGLNFPDALTGSIVAAKENQSILLVKPKELPYYTKKTIQNDVITNFTILGGKEAVTPEVESALTSTVKNLIPKSPKINGNWYYDEDTNKLIWKITWEKINNATQYQIYRKKSEENYKLYKTVNIESVSEYIIDDSIYKYKIKAINKTLSSTLSNEIELNLNNDTDSDGLLDGYEINNSETDPSKVDSDKNGINDAKEDIDSDSLSNIEEQKLNTDPLKADTDLDKINDNQEVNIGTDPLNSDTDSDNLFDGDEKSLGFDPLNKDSNSNSIIDGDEVVEFNTIPDKVNSSKVVTPSVIINSKASEATSTSIVNLQGDSQLTDSIPGYIAPAFEFNTKVKFNEATMKFTYDDALESKDFKPEIFFYNELEQRLERIENQRHDPNSNSVTATVKHFSKYILLNGTEWDKVWENQVIPPPTDAEGNLKDMDIVFSIDSSGSMEWMDPNDLRKEATKQFVDALTENDRSAIVDFDDNGKVLVSLTNDKEKINVAINSIDSSGGTNLYEGVVTAIDEIVQNSSDNKVKYVIFLTDGDGYWNDKAIDYAKENNVIVHTIGLGSGVNEDLLGYIASSTGGKYFFSSDADELIGAIGDTADETLKYKVDEDLSENGEKVGDGLPDYLETSGIINGRGIVVKTDPKNPDSDKDGLLDGEEFTITFDENLDGKIYFKENSDPTEKDTDKDGLGDLEDENPRVYDFTPKHALMLSELAYINMEKYTKGNSFFTIPELIKSEDKFKEKVNQKFKHSLSNPSSELDDWQLIAAEDSHIPPFSGFGAFALKHENKIVISYRGTDGEINLTNLNDWKNNAGILLLNNNAHANDAKEFAADIVMNHSNEETEIYVVGHSLGGFLAQVVGYHLYQNKLDDVYSFWNKKDKEKLRSILSNENYFQYTRTFNSAPFFEPIGPDWAAVGEAVPYTEASSDNYNSNFLNHIINGDPLHNWALKINKANISTSWLGKEEFYDYNNVSKSEHSLPNFYEHLSKMN